MTDIFVNIPTTDLERAKTFYAGLGADVNELFSNDRAACIVWADNIQLMLLQRDFFAGFTTRPVGDPRESTQVLIGISRDSREAVDDTVAAALAGGGVEHSEPQDQGYAYTRTVEDPDGTILEFIWIDPAAAEQGPEAYAAELGGSGA